MIDLPKKDKNGKNCLSYSQISLFLKDKNEFQIRMGNYLKKYSYHIRFVFSTHVTLLQTAGSHK